MTPEDRKTINAIAAENAEKIVDRLTDAHGDQLGEQLAPINAKLEHLSERVAALAAAIDEQSLNVPENDPVAW